MFTAMVLACVMSTPAACVEATDSRGPYPTEQQCFVRVEEMIQSMIPLLPPVPHTYSYKCVAEGTAT